jgi:hypothetical protein
MYGHYSLNSNGSSLHTELMVYNDLLKKFITNSQYFRKNKLEDNPLASKDLQV